MKGFLRRSPFLPALLLLLATGVYAANSIPEGTILPVRLNSTISSAKCKPGQIITARVMQDVPLAGRKIPAGSKVLGRIVSVTPAANSSSSSITIRFDSVETHGTKIPIATNLRAVASFMAVDEAQIPITGADRGTPPDAWTTTQIGGEAVYRGGGHVMGREGRVGEPVYNGILATINANPDGGCRGAIASNNNWQAFWVFSSNACGAYGLPHVNIRHYGRTNPAGEITLESNRGQVNIRSGAGMLLRVGTSSASDA